MAGILGLRQTKLRRIDHFHSKTILSKLLCLIEHTVARTLRNDVLYTVNDENILITRHIFEFLNYILKNIHWVVCLPNIVQYIRNF